MQGAEALGPAAHLLPALFGRHVEHGAPERRLGGEDLEQQRAFADARLATEQRDRAGHEPATEHAIELGDPGRHGRAGRGVDLRDGDRGLGPGECRRGGRAAARLFDIFDEGVPRLTRWAPP